MGATIQQEKNGIWVVRVFGALRKEELDAVQAAALENAGGREHAKVLVLVEDDFIGWVGDEVWNDMTFFVQHGDKIEKIAIVGNPEWKTRMLMFTGAGFRRAPVKYFTLYQLEEARAWLS
ncbi:MAG: STAS/SEC14 domain-containing protein [Geobacteraceae bacterium]|nr:STAS/SEC14 domain-containing protein [Geobacteraceae bacterium]